MMQVQALSIPDVLLFTPKVFGDTRGFFFESFNAREFAESSGLDVQFVQDNHSRSARHVLRGLHYQIRQAQGKLVRVIAGEAFDVAVDIRKSSPTFGQWTGALLSAENRQHLWIPPGFAHGFLALGDYTEFVYKTTDYYAPEHERGIAWDDPVIGIDWNLNGAVPLLSGKDKENPLLAHAEVFA